MCPHYLARAIGQQPIYVVGKLLVDMLATVYRIGVRFFVHRLLLTAYCTQPAKVSDPPRLATNRTPGVA